MLQKLIVTLLAEDSVPYESPLLGQHGLSLWVEAFGPAGRKQILVAAGHCTGFRAQVALYETFREAFQPLGAGKRFVVTSP